MTALRRGINRLIDSYAEGFVDKCEFEPRITGMKQRLSQLEERHKAAVRAAESERDLCLVISRLEDFAAKVSDGLDKLDRAGQRDIIRALVKRIEVGNDGIEIIFRVPPPNAPVRPTAPAKTRPAWQQCTAVRREDLRLAWTLPPPRQGLRSHDRQRRRMGPRRQHPHAHAAHRKRLSQNEIISSPTLRSLTATAAGESFRSG
jgi:site-specific DNA recombinase